MTLSENARKFYERIPDVGAPFNRYVPISPMGDDHRALMELVNLDLVTFKTQEVFDENFHWFIGYKYLITKVKSLP